MKEIKNFHANFYATTSKLVQDAFILKYCSVMGCKRRRPKNETHAPKSHHVTCHVRASTGKNIPVCQVTFLNILGITKHRLGYIMKQFAKTGKVPLENRGGDYKSSAFQAKKDSIMMFINKLRCIESHYCRSATARKYLPCELSIKKLYNMYCVEASDIPVKMSYFRYIFNTNYNLSFKSPQTDVCSTCLQYEERLKQTTDAETKTTIESEKKVHKMRADAFFKLLQEERPDLYTFSFDCEKNLVLPKVPDQTAYYSRQLYLYNFTIVQGSSKSQLGKGNVFSYYWTEDEHAKSSNEIASAVYDRLVRTDFGNKNVTVRLVADGCSGQNKNTIMLGMCSKWLSVNAPKNVECLELVFPVTGHSFLPSDRVFGQLEKKFKKIEVIDDPQKYVDIISQISTTSHLGVDCMVLDWRDAVRTVFKTPGAWHFPFKESKRFYLKRCRSGNILIRGELHYKNDLGTFKGVTKKGKTIEMINPKQIDPEQNPVNHLKLQDVNKLLSKHFGEDWKLQQSLQFYCKLISEEINKAENVDNLEDPELATCEFIEEIPTLLI